MLSFLLQCCCPQRRHQIFVPDSIKHQQMIYSIDDPYIPMTTSPFYDMNVNDDSYSDSSIRFLPSELHLRNSSHDDYPVKHNQEIQTLPGPTITVINMAAERIIDDSDWEEADPFEIQYNSENKRSSSIGELTARYIIDDPSLLQKSINYEKQPDIYIHQPENRKVTIKYRLQSSDDDHDSMASEMSGYDFESIDETIYVFTPKLLSPELLHNEIEYQTAGIDEVEVQMKDFIYEQKITNIYKDNSSPHYSTAD